ncbi:MAG: hypothetical protein ACLQU2_27850 [Candidatus Binataceae bacterium]
MRVLRALVAAILVAGRLGSLAWAQPVTPVGYSGLTAGAHGIPHDWTHEHLIFSRPSSDRGLCGLETKPRFVIQQAWRQRQARAGTVEGRMRWLDALAVQLGNGRPPASWGRPASKSLSRDWSLNMGHNATVGNGMYPAKFSFDVSSPGSCAGAATPDFVVFNTGIAGSTSVPTVLAYDNLYSGCSGTVPSLYWAYNTGSGSVASTSAVLSGDGSQIAFVQNPATGGAQLVLLKWSKSSALATLPNTPAGFYRTCKAPCLTALSFNGAHRDSNSAAFYDYDNDVIYVGDDNGLMHKFDHVVVTGTPAEVTGGWPITVSSGVALSSPVFDSNSGGGASGNVFIGNAAGRLDYVRESNSTRGACVSGTRPCLGTPSISLGGAIVDGPLVDSGTQRVFWFDGTSSNHGEVVQTDTALGSRTTLNIGGGSASSNMHIGSFDNTYYESASNDIKGFLYVCGNNVIYVDRPALFRVGFSSTGVMKTAPAGGPLTLVNNSFEECSPITEVFNGSTDRIFLSVQANGNLGGCRGACLYSFDITNSFPANSSAGLAAADGTSGIIIDNTAAPLPVPPRFISPR